MRRRLVPAVSVQLGTASGGYNPCPNRRRSVSTTDEGADTEKDDSPGTVEEPAFDPRPPPCTLALDDE